MPTEEQMIQAIAEAAGEKCCHTFTMNNRFGDPNWMFNCAMCGETATGGPVNATDLNALFGYARKLGLEVQLQVRFDENWCSVFDGNQSSDIINSSTPAQALLHALYKAATK